MSVRPIGPTDPTLDVWCDLLSAHLRAGAGAAPSGEVLAERIRSQPDQTGTRRWVAHDGSVVIGLAQSSPDGPDGDAVFVRLHVAPAYRRRGVGSALLTAVRDAHPGVTVKSVIVAGEAGQAFADAWGAQVLMRLLLLEQRLADLDRPGVQYPADDPGPAGVTPDAPYRLVFWCDGAPQDLVDSYAQAYRHLSDAPGSHHQLTDLGHDREWIRRWEHQIRRGGHQLWVCAAVVRRTVIAFTEIEVGPEPAACQHATVVLPDHRRRGVGTAVKSALAARLRALRPDVTTVTSTVNEANAAMVGLNKRVGYRPVATRLLLRLPEVAEPAVSPEAPTN